ncbi:hypothetical protein ANCCAN_06523 [Ancylostoma caninum]|uniref:Cytoplasmic tRNA 2-thiolation protein 2 n=1 Tax=Ancylostoma caninum TaxID=29170 RepID=A0A368GVL5_ANCCA|nr:hypothetical protein ANCCAN_06523 [Ancylostoma caninum]
MGPSIPQDEHCLGPSRSAKKCLKCSGEGVVHGSSKMAYCEDCFVAMVKGKFRSTISKRKIFKDSDKKVLVLLDGSIESAFLFRQVEDAVKQKNFKRLMIEPSVSSAQNYKIFSSKLRTGKNRCLFGSSPCNAMCSEASLELRNLGHVRSSANGCIRSRPTPLIRTRPRCGVRSRPSDVLSLSMYADVV